MLSICIFGGSRNGTDPEFARVATRLGAAIAERGHALIYGAGRLGIMGRVAEAVAARQGRVSGVLPKFFADIDVLDGPLCETIMVDDLFQRKARMFELSDAFIALPGGLGTLDELLEVLTWRQLHQVRAPIGVLNVAGFFDPFFDLLQHCARHGFADSADIDRLIRADNVHELLDLVATEHASR
jgi:uncharacterized protein (TIGR00730 family)